MPTRVPCGLQFDDSPKLLKIRCNTPYVIMQSPTTGISFQHPPFPPVGNNFRGNIELQWPRRQDRLGCRAGNFYKKRKKAKHYKRFWPHISQGSRVAALIQDLPTQPLNGHDAPRVSRSVLGVMKLQWVIPDTCDFLCYRLKDVKIGQETDVWNFKL